MYGFLYNMFVDIMRYVCIVVFFLLSTLPVYAELKISEVYIQWHQEWLEIYNTSNQQFEWTISLSWVKASLVTMPNITILPHEVVIVGDSLAIIPDTSNVVASWLSLFLGDSVDALIHLLDGSGHIQDTVYIDQETVSTMSANKASRQRIFTTPIQEAITTESYIHNIQSPHRANPWIVYAEEQDVIDTIPELLISEVYFEWANERIEITNRGNTDFNWVVEISWASANPKTFTLSIPANQSIIIADTNSHWMILDESVIGASNAWFVINDDGDIDISLYVDAVMLDRFDVEESLVLPYINGKNSFEKVLYQGNWVITITPEERVYNMTGQYKWNPWMVYEVTQTPIQIQEWVEEQECEVASQEIIITEIHKESEKYPAYIEVFIANSLAENILFSWSLIANSIHIDVTEKEWYYLITPDPSAFFWQNIIQASFSLSPTGQLTITRQNGQVLDKVDITVDNETTDNQSLSYKETVVCVRYFDSVSPFSPWFDDVYLEYFPEWKTITQTVYVWWWGWSCPVPEDNNNQENGTGTWEEYQPKDISIVHIEYDPSWPDTYRETITLQSFLPYTVNLAEYNLSVSTRSSLVQLSGILYSWATQTFTGNYRFPNSWACVWLLFSTQILDTYCYWSAQAQWGSWSDSTGPVSQTWQTVSWQYSDYRNAIVRIEYIDYDPPWSDIDKETIVFSVLSWWVDFSYMYLLINERKYTMKSFTWYVTWTVSFTANFRFPNSGACVRLVYEETVFDTYCYNPNDGSPYQEEPIDYSTYIIRIKELIYDPPGNDKDRESITLHMLSWDTVDLSKFRLKVKTTNRIIQWSLSPWSAQTFVWNFRMPNDGACISLMRNDHTFDTVCYTPTQDTQEDEKSIDYSSHTISINHIDYDPPWADTDRETIQLFLNPYVFLSDDFYLLINDTKRYLRHFTWEYQWDTTLTWNFRFPNSKDTCVRIWRESFIFDEYCYVVGETQEDEAEPKDLPEISIQAVFPNPVWVDSDQEYVILRLHTQESVDLSQWYTLYINGRNKTLQWDLVPWQDIHIQWTLWLPNTATCVSLMYDKRITIDTFCYELPREWYEYRKSQEWLEFLSTIDLTVLRNIQFRQEWGKICIRYDGILISCRNNRIRITKEADQELRLYKNYINTMHDYMINQRSSLFYNSSLVLYRDILKESESLLSRWITQQHTKHWPVAVTDIAQRFDLQYNQSFLDYLGSQIPDIPWIHTRQIRYSNIKNDRYLQLLTKR